MGRILTFLLLAVALSFSQGLKESLRAFFEREGYVLKVEGERVLVDVKDLRKGEELVLFREGKEIIHPITKQPLGRELETVGRAIVEEVGQNFSVGKLMEGKDIRIGDRVRVHIRSVCFEGSEEGLFLMASVFPSVEKGKNCQYVIKEFEKGYGVEFNGSAVAFFEKESLGRQRAGVEDLNILVKGRFIKQLSGLAVSADVGDVFGDGREYLVVLYSSRVEVYELLPKDILLKVSYPLPAGVAVSLTVAKVGEEDRDYILVSMISGNRASSVVLKVVSGVFVPVAKDVPYLFGVLDKSKPKETFLGQRFDTKARFSNVVKLRLEGDRLKEAGPFLAPKGFRIDSAFYYKNYLVFVDGSGRLKVFEEGSEVFSSEVVFDGSYASVDIMGDTRESFIFYPKASVVRILDYDLALVPRNTASSVLKFLDVLKFARGELVIVGEKKKSFIVSKTVRGSEFVEAIQSVVSTRDGRVFVITGRVGTIPVQNKGELYELEFRLL